MVELYFRMVDVPRTVGREEWKRIHKWTRIKRRELAELREAKLQAMLQAPPEPRNKIMDEMINPPLLAGPYMLGSKW